MYVVCKTRSVLDRNLICFIITPPATTQLTSFFLAAHFTRPRMHLLSVVSLRSATGRCGLIRLPCLKLRPLSYPSPAKKFDQTPLKNEAATPSPGRSSPCPCDVHLMIVVSLRSATGWCGKICLPGRKLRPLSYPPPRRKIRQKSPGKNNAATPSTGRSSPRPRMH